MLAACCAGRLVLAPCACDMLVPVNARRCSIAAGSAASACLHTRTRPLESNSVTLHDADLQRVLCSSCISASPCPTHLKVSLRRTNTQALSLRRASARCLVLLSCSFVLCCCSCCKGVSASLRAAPSCSQRPTCALCREACTRPSIAREELHQACTSCALSRMGFKSLGIL